MSGVCQHAIADREKIETAYCRMIVCKSIIYFHVYEKPLDVHLEELFNLQVIELRINKYRTDVSFHHIR